MKNFITVIILSVAIFASGFYAGQKVERNEILQETKLLYDYAALLEKENAKIYRILYKYCRK